jgi:glycosyltransferase involved in cell wall biosynthesis
MKLSILICHLEARSAPLKELLSVLQPQVDACDDVELRIRTDDGTETVGHKRNKLLYVAKGDYICYVDDDDMVPGDYVQAIVGAICGNRLIYDPTTGTVVEGRDSLPDVIGLKGHMVKAGGNKPEVFIHSIKYGNRKDPKKSWFSKEGIYYRCPNHISPVKRELALETRFPEIDHGEDRDYSLRLLPLLMSEVFIDKCMYVYRAK